MADVLHLAPLLLFVLLLAVAAAPAAAKPRTPELTLDTVAAGNFNEPARNRHDPVFGPALGRRFVQEEDLPTWTLPLGPSARERDRRGLSFRVRPGHGVKAMARLRF
jgi:hypothetical protein